MNNTLSEIATEAYNQMKNNFDTWSQAEFFNAEKYQPEVYKMVATVDRLHNNIIAIGQTEVERCSAIIAISAKINDYCNTHHGLFTTA